MTTHDTGAAERRLPRGRQSRSAWLNVAALLAATLTWPSPTRAQVVEYYHHDALGSIRAVSNQAGQIISYHDYLPYGEELNPQPDPQPLRFTGKERDTETGLDYFGARYYGAKTGRFTAVDPVYTWRENVGDPQRWNRYAYVTNNPLRYVDPDGRIRRDANGRIIFVPVGDPVSVTHPSGPSSTVQPGYVLADDGRRIEAFKNVGPDPRFKCDCHGLTFADGEYWINNDQVAAILSGDSYEAARTQRVGDIGVYRDASGVVHSVTVTAVDQAGRATAVSGLGGLELAAHSDSPGAVWPDPAARVDYYRKVDDRRSPSDRQNDAERIRTYRKN